ncbi:MAG: hypothetical protein ICV60_03735 [Pyrinomonadaceae bacterium]|nr:hypothetical protein [Pyrinomonadaceae bacterium]
MGTTVKAQTAASPKPKQPQPKLMPQAQAVQPKSSGPKMTAAPSNRQSAPGMSATQVAARPGQQIIQPSIGGVFRFLGAYLFSCVERRTSRYRLKRDAATRQRFRDSLRSHNVKRRYYANEISQQQYGNDLAQLAQQGLPPIPNDVYLNTTATMSSQGGVYNQGTLTITATFADQALQNLADTAHGADHQRYNEFDASLGVDRAGDKFVDANTAYGFPIGMAVGNILMYEAAYQAVRKGYTRITLGMGEGQAAQMWQQRYAQHIRQPAPPQENDALLNDDRPAPKPSIAASTFLIGAWSGIGRYWDKA